MSEECKAVKHGVIDLRCSMDRGHDEPKGGLPGSWHEATFVDEREILYPGARHLISIRETVSWEPVDHAAEATRHIMAGRGPREIADSARDALDGQRCECRHPKSRHEVMSGVCYCGASGCGCDGFRPAGEPDLGAVEEESRMHNDKKPGAKAK